MRSWLRSRLTSGDASSWWLVGSVAVAVGGMETPDEKLVRRVVELASGCEVVSG